MGAAAPPRRTVPGTVIPPGEALGPTRWAPLMTHDSFSAADPTLLTPGSPGTWRAQFFLGAASEILGYGHPGFPYHSSQVALGNQVLV